MEAIARIDAPAPDQTLPLRPALAGGGGYAGARGVGRVELSADGGTSWREAQLEPPLPPATGGRWAAPWEPPSPGEYTLVAQAYAADGTPQTAAARKSGAGGATGYATRQVTIGNRAGAASERDDDEHRQVADATACPASTWHLGGSRLEP